MSIDTKIPQPWFERTVITPEHAQELLGHNLHNRKVRESHVARLSTTLVNGEWQFNGQPIQIAANGVVLDGQHRLIACARTGVAIDVLVVHDASSSSQETMDLGRTRTTADILALRGYKEAAALAAFSLRALALEKTTLKEAFAGQTKQVTPASIVQFVESFDGQDRYVREARNISARVNLPGATVGLAMWITDAIDFEDSDFFWTHLANGTDLEEGSPILALRRWALDPNSDKSRRGGQAGVITGARIIKAWNKFRAGESLTRLTWNPGGANPEKFPEAI